MFRKGARCLAHEDGRQGDEAPRCTQTGTLMASCIELAPEVAEDFDRILDYLASDEVENPGQRIGEIVAALEILAQNPLIARPVVNAKRELVIGHRSHGYVALYRYVPEMDAVFVLAIRSEREAGYSERDPAG